MNEKELREIKRRFRPDKNNILSIRGCLVNGEKTIISRFNQPMAACSVEEGEKLLGIMKKSLSGGLGTNLIDLDFPADAPTTSEPHQLLMTLRNSSLKDEEALERFYAAVIESIRIEGTFVILLACDHYDVYSFHADGEKSDSSELYTYIVCSICPVKPLNAGLYFREYDSTFRAIEEHTMLSAPELGFLFPAFDDRAANIYGALYYTKDISNPHAGLIDRIFGLPLPMSSVEQKDHFEHCLTETLADECDFEVVRSVHNQIAELVQEHKEQKQEEPLKLSKKKLKTVLEYCGIGEEKVSQFGDRFEEQFGSQGEVSPSSIVNVKKFEVTTPDVSIKVNPERTDLVSTQIIGGVRYIMIRANEGVEVNGVSIKIKE